MTKAFLDQISEAKKIALQNALLEADVTGVVMDAEYLPLGRSRENWKVTLEGHEKPVVVSLFNHQNHTYTPAYQANMQRELAEAGIEVPKI
ncbi:MAG: hypothetical protein P8P30_08150 [Rickettsiales bacterium]|nr:hypothetical protein [Rickettsiales bacterium]